MKISIEVDTNTGEAGYRSTVDMVARVFGFAASSAPLASATATAAPSAPGASIPAPGGAPQAAAPTTPPPASVPASAPSPSPLPAAAPPAPPPAAAPPAPAAAPEVSPNGVTRAAFAAAVAKYAEVYKPAGTKARYKQMSEHFVAQGVAGADKWTSNSAVPVEYIDHVLPWFQVQ